MVAMSQVDQATLLTTKAMRPPGLSPGAGPQRPTSAVGERGERGVGETDRADGS